MSRVPWLAAAARVTLPAMRATPAALLAALGLAIAPPARARADAPSDAPGAPRPIAAAAEPPAPPAAPRPRPYRGMMMIGDATAALFIGGGAALTWRNRDCACEDFSGQLAVIGAMMYVSWGAFAHHDAGHDGRAVASVVVRVGLPTAAALVAHDRGASTAASFLAAGGGVVAGMAIDWALARRAAPPPAALSIYAAPRPADGGAIAGVTGTW